MATDAGADGSNCTGADPGDDEDDAALFGDQVPQPQPKQSRSVQRRNALMQSQPTRPSKPGKPNNALMQLQSDSLNKRRIAAMLASDNPRNRHGTNQSTPRVPAPPLPETIPDIDPKTIPDDLVSRYTSFTDHQLAICSMLMQGMSLQRIADQLKCTKQAVALQIKHTGMDAYRLFTREQCKALSIVRWERLKLQAIDTATLTMDKAGPYQATMIAAVAQDKALALETPAPSREIVDEVTLTLRRVSRGAGNTTCSVRGAENYLSEGETQKH